MSVLYGSCIKSVAFGRFGYEAWKRNVELGDCTIEIASKALRLGVLHMRHKKIVELGECTIKNTLKALRSLKPAQ